MKAVNLLIVCLPLALGCERTSGAPELARWTAQEDLRIGSAEDPEQAFQWVGGLAVSPNGTIFATVPNDHNVRVYGADGALIRVFGRLGGGPGEFSNPGPIGSVGDTLWVFDMFSSRVTFFSATGTFLRTLDPLVKAPNLGNAQLVFQSVLPDGSILTQARPRQQTQPGEVQRFPLIRLFLNGSTDTVAITTNRAAALIIRHGDGELHMMQPFITRVAPGVSNTDRTIVTAEAGADSDDGSSYRLSKFNPQGDTVFTVEQKVDPVRLENRVIEAKVDELTEMGRKTMGDRAPNIITLKEGVREALYVPAYDQVVTGLVVGNTGRIFVRNVEVGDSVHWTVFSPKGEPLARLATSRHMRIGAADADHLYGTGTDDLDVPVIVRYRIRRSL